MTLPPNFSQAVDLSSLGKPPADTSTPMPGLEITPQNLQTEVLPLSEGKPVVILCWSPRSADSVTMLRALGTIESEDKGKWVLAHVNVEEQAPVAQALQVRTIPFGIVFIGGKAIPFLEQPLTEAQLREVIAKILSLAAQQGIGEEPVEQAEPEEEEALAALDQGDYPTAEAAYKRLVARKPIDLHLQCADIEVMSGYLDSAFDRLLRLLVVLVGDEQNRVKNHLLELFTLVDPADPLVIKARAQLANALF